MDRAIELVRVSRRINSSGCEFEEFFLSLELGLNYKKVDSDTTFSGGCYVTENPSHSTGIPVS